MQQGAGVDEMNEITAILGRAQSRGWRLLPEPDGFRLLAALGLPLPASLEFDQPESLSADDLTAIRGDRIVLKAVCPDLPHKSESGGILFLPRDIEAVREAARQMLSDMSNYDLQGFLLQEWIDYDHEVGSELLVNLRWDREFGPILTCGPGGVHTELLGEDLKQERGLALMSTDLAPSSWAGVLAATTVVELMTTGRRGRPPRHGLDRLAEALGSLARQAGPILAAGVDEIEINPLVVHGNRLMPLDVLVRVSSGRPEPELDRPMEKLDRLLQPRSIAIVGVSRQHNPGHVILQNILREGFDAENIFVVKPGETRIEGCRCFPDVETLPGPVDLLIVAIAADQVSELMERVIAGRWAESVIVIPGGLNEKPGGESKVERLLESLHRARQEEWRGPVVNGGNSMGIRSAPGHYDTFFLPDYKVPAAGPINATAALIAQSGAFLVARSSKLSSIPFKYSISIGNQLDLTLGDYLEFLVDDSSLEVIAVYAEGFKTLDGLKFLRAAKKLRDKGRTVVLYRAGRSAEGVRAAASHTASLAGSYATTVALARAAGVLVAESMADFEDLVELSVRLADRRFQGRRLAGLSNAGFECVALSDHLGWFVAAEMSRETINSLQEILDLAGVAGLVEVRNPLDVTPIMGDELYAQVVELLLADPNVDVGVVGCVPLTGALDTLPAGPSHGEDLHALRSIASKLVDLWQKTTKAWIAVVDGGDQYDPLVEVLRSSGIPTFRTMDRAMSILEMYGRGRLHDRAAGAIGSGQG